MLVTERLANVRAGDAIVIEAAFERSQGTWEGLGRAIHGLPTLHIQKRLLMSYGR